jgi:site-specific DNA-cytosine methylase
LTTGHDRARNITEPKGGHKQMGVLEIIHPLTEMEMNDVISQLHQMFPKRGILVYKGQPCFVRKLSTRELYRLMDVDDIDIDILLSTDIPKTQHAKMAGNSIVVNVLYHIFKKLFIETEPEEGQQLTLF